MGSQFQKDFYQNDWNSRVDAKKSPLDFHPEYRNDLLDVSYREKDFVFKLA